MSIVAIPGQPGESIDSRILPDLSWLIGYFKLKITDGYSTSGVHSAAGEHPAGLAVDAVPDTAKGGTWDLVGRAAAYAKAHPQTFRWVGYNGEPNHGDPAHAGDNAHLHLSWLGKTGQQPAPLPRAGVGASGSANVGAGGGGLSAGQLAGLAAAPLLGPIGVGAAGANALRGNVELPDLNPVEAIVEQLSTYGPKLLLFVVLILGGAALIITGAARTVGISPTSIVTTVATRKAAT